MRINGKWKMCDDGVIRPLIDGHLMADNGIWEAVEFLLDTGADRTVLNAAVMAKLGLSTHEPEEEISGLGGITGSVIIETKLNLQRDDGMAVIFTSRFTAVTDPTALDFCILGRDILDLFSIILDRAGDVVCLLSQRHRYAIIYES